MTDNITVTPGSGSTVAADDVGGVLHQRVKVSIGADGSATDLAFGQGAMAASLPVAIASNDDIQAKLGIVTETAPANDTASSGLNGRLQRIAQNLTTAMGRAVAQLGARTVAQSPAVNIATDDTILGATNETAASSDTATSGLNGRLQRIAQRLTSLIALLPASLGAKTAANSLAVTLATDDVLVAPVGGVTEAAPASDTASSGLNGRLQRVAQRLTSIIALLPAALGQGTMAQSLRVVLPSDQSTLPVNQATAAFDIAVTITRPANTTPYSASDDVGGALTFTSIGPSASTIMITGAQLELDISAIPSGMTNFRLHLYNVTPPSALSDNGAWDLPSGDRASYLGFLDLGAPADLGSTCYVETNNLNKQIKLSSANLFAYLVTVGGFTPAANSEVYKLTLHSQAV